MKDNTTVPVYKDESINSKPPTFTSTVEFTYRDKFYKGVSSIFKSKKLAQFNAAKNGLSQIVNLDKNKYSLENSKSKNYKNKRIFVLIDYENYNDDKEIDLFKTQQKDILTIKFTNTKHPRAEKADKLVPSDRRDATDIFIVCETALIKDKFPDAYIFIVTRDKFASVLADIYSNTFNTVTINETFNKLNEI
uniref:DRBM domain-containing protein n=1 Tax=viral metagenome TaxID=1070528 RepID=A0A6C0AC14_9ZZZZ